MFLQIYKKKKEEEQGKTNPKKIHTHLHPQKNITEQKLRKNDGKKIT